MDIKDKTVKVECGTYETKNISFKISDYGKFDGTSASKTEQNIALSLLVSTMDDRNFANDGHRNKGAVSLSIALHVLGCVSPRKWLLDFFSEHEESFHRMDRNLMDDHMIRVEDYLRRWGPVGNEGAALQYLLE